VVNYPNDYDFIRITEYKYFTGHKHQKTAISKEFPEDYNEGKNIPCYPIPTEENLSLYEKYRQETLKLYNTFFLGRLAEYKYYNMDQVIYNALKLFKEKISKNV
jgi:UDP-galactopyranose mutase